MRKSKSESVLVTKRVRNGFIAQGTYGDVSEERITIYGESREHATKHIFMNDEEDREIFMREIIFLTRCNHENIVKLFGYYIDEDDLGFANGYMFLELCEKESFFDVIHKRGISGKDKIQLCIQITNGMIYLHETLGVIHGDLKRGNILFGKDGKVKICDFGSSRRISCNEIKLEGTVQYMAPEIMNNYIGNKPTEKKEALDIYSFGILMWEIFSDKMAYVDIKIENVVNLLTLILQKNIRPDISAIKINSKTIRTLIQNCWTFNPDGRPSSFTEIRKVLIKEFERDDDLETKIELEPAKKEEVRRKRMRRKRMKKKREEENPKLTPKVEAKPKNLKKKRKPRFIDNFVVSRKQKTKFDKHKK